MLQKKKLGLVHLYVYELQCDHCTYRNVLFLGNAYTDVIGVECNVCQNRIWLNNRQNSILSRPEPVFSSREEYLKWTHDIDQEFLATLPTCNVCGAGKFVKFILNVPGEPIVCQDCHKRIDNHEWKDVSERLAETDVFWYEED